MSGSAVRGDGSARQQSQEGVGDCGELPPAGCRATWPQGLRQRAAFGLASGQRVEGPQPRSRRDRGHPASAGSSRVARERHADRVRSRSRLPASRPAEDRRPDEERRRTQRVNNGVIRACRRLGRLHGFPLGRAVRKRSGPGGRRGRTFSPDLTGSLSRNVSGVSNVGGYPARRIGPHVGAGRASVFTNLRNRETPSPSRRTPRCGRDFPVRSKRMAVSTDRSASEIAA